MKLAGSWQRLLNAIIIVCLPVEDEWVEREPILPLIWPKALQLSYELKMRRLRTGKRGYAFWLWTGKRKLRNCRKGISCFVLVAGVVFTGHNRSCF